ncbi:MAG: preprotein translocase subunit SecG [Helicobacteraceae bacterium]|jgi:preprotein translocase subunit SecG|nr:preprotein translocase subunit SecG [Helicobacteraceae bacterium]
MTSVLLIAQFVLAAIIVVVVLLQKSSSIGLGAYSGSNESLFGSRGPSGFLAKVTAFFSALIVANSIALTYIYYSDRDASALDRVVIPTPAANTESQTLIPLAPDSAIVPEAPNVPNAPIVPEAPKE